MSRKGVRETVDAPEMEKVAAELMGSIGWHGVAELDFRWEGTAEARPNLIEVNPRFFGGTYSRSNRDGITPGCSSNWPLKGT